MAIIFSRNAHACFMSCDGPQSTTNAIGQTDAHSTPIKTFTNRVRLRPALETKCAEAHVVSSPVPSIAASWGSALCISWPMLASTPSSG